MPHFYGNFVSALYIFIPYLKHTKMKIFEELHKVDYVVNYCKLHPVTQSRSTPTSGPPKVSARAPAHRSYHCRGVKLKSCIKKIHHNLYISKQANVRIKHADTEGASHKKFGTDARVQ